MSFAPPIRRAAPLRLGLAIPWRELRELALLYAAGGVCGFAVLVALFKLGVLANVDVLFYRGLILIGLAFLATLGGLVLAIRRGAGATLSWRDAMGAAAISLAFNLCFFVVAPVTVDRSISVFILGQMTAHAGRSYSAAEMSRLFSDVYVGDDRQIERRMSEQALSGNVEDLGGRYRISARGAAFIRVSQAVAWMFDADPRFVSPPAARPAKP